MDDYYKANRSLWDEWTELHRGSPLYGLEGFLRGENRLHDLERGELGNVQGKSLLHLQCHFGLDSLSWARLGAQVTGVDFSGQAVRLARQIAEQAGVEARFIESNLYDLPAILDETFDIVYTSYGVLIWLHDLPAWGRLVAHFLKPGGTFYMVEFHPFTHIFEETAAGDDLNIAWRYFSRPEPEAFEPQGSYVDREAMIEQPVEYEWSFSLSDVLNSLLEAGLRLEFLHEFPFTIERSAFPNLLEPGADGYYRLKRHAEAVPLMFSVRAVKDVR